MPKARRLKRRRLFRNPYRPAVSIAAETRAVVQVNGDKSGSLVVQFIEARPNDDPKGKIVIEMCGPANTRLVAIMPYEDFEHLVAPVLLAPEAASQMRAARYP